MEAAINELFQDIADKHENYIKAIDQDIRQTMKSVWDIVEKRNILEKYQLALAFAKLETFPKGGNPYRDTELAIKLRNELVHFKPKTVGGLTTHKFTQMLRGKFQLNLLMSNPSNPFFPEKCLGKGCAEWVLKSCLSFADEFFEKIQVFPNYQRLKEINIESLRKELKIGGK